MDFSSDEGWFLIRKDGRSQPLLPGMMFVGREECDFTLQSASSDKRHAVIFFDGLKKEIHIKDLNSLTGTYVNGMRIPEQTYVKLEHLDNLRFGYGPDIFHVQNCRAPYRITKKDNLKCSDKTKSVYKCEAEESRKIKLQDSLENLKSSDNVPNLQSKEICSELKNKTPSSDSSTLFKRSDTQIISSSSSQPNEHSAINTEKLIESVPGVRSETKVLSTLMDGQLAKSDIHNHAPTLPLSVNKKEEPEEEIPNSALAFTVAFDNQTPKKKFSIRDSISKYAPRKIEAVVRQKQEKPPETPIKKSPDCGILVELRRKKGPAENGEKINQSVEKKTSEPKLSHGASYLIQKMFKEDKKTEPAHHKSYEFKRGGIVDPPVPQPASPKNETPNDDNKSDTGTYTIDEELNAKDVKEAREKIDEVFGVVSPPDERSHVQEDKVMSPVLQVISNEQHQSLKPDEEQPSLKDLKEALLGKDPAIIPPPRTKRRLPTPPILSSSENESSPTREDPPTSTLRYYDMRPRASQAIPSTTIHKSKLHDLSVEPQSFENSISLPKDRSSIGIPSSRLMSNNRLTLNNLELLQNTVGSGRSALVNGHGDVSSRRISPSARHFQQRSPWNHLSGSDMDLDQLRVETSSVLSDVSVSTEPPSINCPPSSSKSDIGPTMKFNRAFALRRARLGLETDMPIPSRVPAVKETKPTKDVNRLSPYASSPLSRQDGGRFSLRLPKSTSKSIVTKNFVPLTKSVSKPAPSVSKPPASSQNAKFGHRRTDSDPSKTSFLRKGSDQKMTMAQSNKLKSNAIRPAFQRASSFSNNPDIEIESNLPKSSSWKSESLSQAGLHRQIPRISQGPVKDDMYSAPENDFLGRESRASSRLSDKSLSPIDNVVIQATHNLSAKLRTIAYRLLIKERDKFTEDSNERLMIDEVLPRVCDNVTNTCTTCVERGVSQELSSILKNLTKVEQSLEVLTLVIDEERLDPRRMNQHQMPNPEDNLYVVNV